MGKFYEVVDFKINKAGFVELFRSEGMKRFVEENGSEIARRASAISGEDYGHDTHLAEKTAICSVYPNSKEAAKDNLENNTLLKASSGYPRKKLDVRTLK